MGEPGNDSNPSVTRRSIEMGALALLVVVFLIVSLAVHKPWSAEAGQRADVIGTIIAAGLTLIMYSFLYRDNPLFKIAENLYVGVALGYGAIITWRESLLPEIVDPFFRPPTWAAFWSTVVARTVPAVLGVLLVTRLSRRVSWLSRYSYGLMVGWGAGFFIFAVTDSNILTQLYAALVPLQKGLTQQEQLFSGAWLLHAVLPLAGAAAVLIGTVSVLFYFFFSIEHKHGGQVVSRVGIWFLMISFGATFGYTVMGRLALLVDRFQFLLFRWLALPLPT